MANISKLEADVEIKASAAKFHEYFTQRPHHISNISSDKIKACDLHEGEWGKVGSITQWNYVHDGKVKSGKKVLEAIDNENNSITFKVLEADLLDHYKSFKFIIQATPKGEGCSVVHWILEYEKLHSDVTDPHTLLQLAVDMTTDIGAHLSMANIGKLEINVEIKASAEKFHEYFTQRPHHISSISSDKVKGCDLHEGEWGKVGSVIQWNYVQDGEAKIAKTVLETIDNDNNSITIKVLEGDLLDHYKSFKVIIQAIPKGEGCTVVHWTLEYEKLHDDVTDPHTLLQLHADMIADIGAHLSA